MLFSPDTFLPCRQVCNIIIALFSPTWKATPKTDKSEDELQKFIITSRILKIVAILLESYNSILKTESEIFLSFLIKFLDGENWQRAIAVEVLHKICWRPKQLRNICQHYDLQQQCDGSTPVFEQLINSLSTLSSKLFDQIHAKDENGGNPEHDMLDDLSINKLALNSETQGGARYYYLESTVDRNEIPFVSEDYVLRMAISTQLDIAAAIIDLGDKELIKRRVAKCPIHLENDEEKTLRQMISSGWCGLLQTLSLLFEAAPDESTVSSVLDTMIALTAVAGGLNMDGPREALVGSLCRFALPPGYLERGGSSSSVSSEVTHGQVLVMGQPLSPSTSSGAGFVLLTTRNIQVLRALLDVAFEYGPLLGQSWSLLLSALQHLAWILGFKPSLTGEMTAKSSKENGQSTVLTTAITQEMPNISNRLFLVFERSKLLDEVALHHLVNALCEQSSDTMDQAYGSYTKEPSLFAVAKLIQVAQANLERLEVLWKLITGHLLEVCQHTNFHFRKWGSDGLSLLITSAIVSDENVSNQRRRDMVLSTFADISSIPRIDVRTRQMECVLEVLETCGEKLNSAWPVLLNIIQASCESLKDQAVAESDKLNRQLSDSFLAPQSPTDQKMDQKTENQEREVLVKSGFRAIQLVVTDFLSSIPPSFLDLTIQSTMRFGSQQQSLNISLTAIGLLWNIVDFLSHDLTTEESKDVQDLWLSLYRAIGVLCVDQRPSVRKSAGQTLFGTITAHGSSLDEETWRRLFWDILFPILDDAETATDNPAVVETKKSSSQFLVHHSRDTAEKQWAETKRLTLQGLTKLFKENKSGLSPPEWVRCWKGMLQYIEKASYSDNAEVSGGALESFRDLLESCPEIKSDGKLGISILLPALTAAWSVWINVADKMLLKYEGSQHSTVIPKQEFLQSWSCLLPMFIDKIKDNMT